jgi:hypothetical protein
MPTNIERLLDNLEKLTANDSKLSQKFNAYVFVFDFWKVVHFGFINVYNLMLEMGNDDFI